MTFDECLTCKKHYTQDGKCMENKRNCLMYENEPRGKKVRTKVTFEFNVYPPPEQPIIAFGKKIIFEEDGKEFEAVCIKINWINLETGLCNIDIDYWENEKPRFEKKKMFKIVK